MSSCQIAGWGNYPAPLLCNVLIPESQSELELSAGSQIARGQGRSYGDAAINSQGIVHNLKKLNRILAFDLDTGRICLEAGVTLHDLLPLIISRGWFVAVTPGTQFVTVGGCVAFDVHGKNHHRLGSFGECIEKIKLLLADGSILYCSRTLHSEIFRATVGGMGLTGIILEIELQLIPIETADIYARYLPTSNLKETFSALDSHSSATYSVVWIDNCNPNLGRGILMLGEHATKEMVESIAPFKKEHPMSIPARLFSPALMSGTVKSFNQLYYYYHSRKSDGCVPCSKFFYPLDKIANWNQLYGKSGFIQYQCVVPLDNAFSAMEELLSLTYQKTYLVVLKQFGKKRTGYLSFAMEGITIALDMPASSENLALVLKLDEITLKYGGRVYFAKNTTIPSNSLSVMYPEYPIWLNIKRSIDPLSRFESDLYRRILQ